MESSISLEDLSWQTRTHFISAVTEEIFSMGKFLNDSEKIQEDAIRICLEEPLKLMEIAEVSDEDHFDSLSEPQKSSVMMYLLTKVAYAL